MVQPAGDVALAPLTTLGVGGAARWFASARNARDVLDVSRWVGDRGCELFVLGGGSNLVVADRGFDGLVLRIDALGCELRIRDDELLVDAAAGESWDAVVARTVDAGFSGLECLSGIPGRVGGTPIQNVGAYGQEVAQSIAGVTALDCTTGRVVRLTAQDCEFSYRQSRFKSRDRGRFIVTSVAFRLGDTPPVLTYPDVIAHAKRQGVREPSVADVRQWILDIRRRKGMVLNAADVVLDPDTRSVGSFFMNPTVTEATYAGMARIAARSSPLVPSGGGEGPPGFPTAQGGVKVPAAWLIERSGFSRGHVAGRTGLSSKHPLAIVNRGGATAREIIEFAALVKRRVAETFGVWLQPEPVFVGFTGDETISFLQKANG